MNSPDHVFTFHPDGVLPGPGEVFVFGSNESGRHGKGAALVARQQFGARYGVGVGRQNMSYAIPTKDGSTYLKTLPLDSVHRYVNDFIAYAAANPKETFFVSRIGCGLAGFRDSEIAPLFSGATENCIFAVEWEMYLAPKQSTAAVKKPEIQRFPRPG